MTWTASICLYFKHFGIYRSLPAMPKTMRTLVNTQTKGLSRRVNGLQIRYSGKLAIPPWLLI